MSCCKYASVRCYCSKPIKTLYQTGDIIRAVIGGTEVTAQLSEDIFTQEWNWSNYKVITLSPTTVQLLRND